jgi:hypothetical protein
VMCISGSASMSNSMNAGKIEDRILSVGELILMYWFVLYSLLEVSYQKCSKLSLLLAWPNKKVWNIILLLLVVLGFFLHFLDEFRHCFSEYSTNLQWCKRKESLIRNNSLNVPMAVRPHFDWRKAKPFRNLPF